MENLKSTYEPQDANLTKSKAQEKISSEKTQLPKVASHTSKECPHDNVVCEDHVDEDKILHNGEGLDPEEFDERSDFRSKKLDILESEEEDE